LRKYSNCFCLLGYDSLINSEAAFSALHNTKLTVTRFSARIYWYVYFAGKH